MVITVMQFRRVDELKGKYEREIKLEKEVNKLRKCNEKLKVCVYVCVDIHTCVLKFLKK